MGKTLAIPWPRPAGLEASIPLGMEEANKARFLLRPVKPWKLKHASQTRSAVEDMFDPLHRPFELSALSLRSPFRRVGVFLANGGNLQ
jgi:hypothetical protein